MGSSSDGSGQMIQNEEVESAKSRFFGWLFNVLAFGSGQSGAGVDAAQAPPSLASLPGLGVLRRLRINDVAVPKVDIVAVPFDIDKDNLVAVFREHGFSRLPVYKGTLDHPQGLVLLKDLALQHGFGTARRWSLKRLLRPVLYVPPSMPIGVLLQKMQRERVHMALVIDEYGGVDGLVTIEDLIETVIGEIEDEHDEEEGALWKKEKQGVFLCMANAPLEEIETAIGLRLRTDEEIDTLGGIVFLRTGRVPTQGEIVHHESGAEFEVVDADSRRIKRVRIRLPKAVDAGSSTAERAVLK